MCCLRSVYDGGERRAAPCHARRLPSLPSSLLFRHTLRSLPKHESSLSPFLSFIIVLPSLHTDLLLFHTLRSSSKHQSSLSFFLSMMIVLSTDTLVCSLSCIPRRSPAVACSHPIMRRNPSIFIVPFQIMRVSFQLIICSNVIMKWKTYRYFGHIPTCVCTCILQWSILCRNPPLRTLHSALLSFALQEI